jgi:predicted  nucleic acid-binding Zn-ribbon protein
MAERERTKAKRAAARPEEASNSVNDAVQRLEARTKSLELERDGLKAELEAARARIGALEVARDKVVGKIDGMLDSLNSVVGKD